MVWGFILPGFDHNAVQFLFVRVLAAQDVGHVIGQFIRSV